MVHKSTKSRLRGISCFCGRRSDAESTGEAASRGYGIILVMTSKISGVRENAHVVLNVVLFQSHKFLILSSLQDRGGIVESYMKSR